MMSQQPLLSEGSTVEMPPRDSSSQVRIALLADTADSKKPSTSSRQMSTTTTGQNQEFANLYRIDEAKSANSLMKWQQSEEERERKAAAVGQAYSNIAPTSTSVSASAAAVNKNVWSMSSASILAHDVLGKLGDLRLHLLADIPNISSGLILASSAIIVAVIFIFAALIHKLKARRRTKNAKVVGPSGPDIIKRRNSNEPCSNDSGLISHSYARLENSTSHQNTTGLVRKSSRRRSLGAESSPPNAAFASCHQRDTAFAKDRRADTLVNTMPPDMGGKYKQRIFFARRHSLTQSTCRVLDAALSAESKNALGGGNGGEEEEEISMSSGAFDLDV